MRGLIVFTKEGNSCVDELTAVLTSHHYAIEVAVPQITFLALTMAAMAATVGAFVLHLMKSQGGLKAITL